MSKSMLEIRDEIGAWAKKNFKPEGMHPELGILEEVGEAAHAIIKNLQGIRGMDNPETFKEALADAVADCGIYALHFCFLNGIEPPETALFSPQDNVFATFRKLGKSAAQLIGTDDYGLMIANINRLFDALFTLASKHGIQLFNSIRSTWEKVSKRDWVENPTDAHEKASAEDEDELAEPMTDEQLATLSDEELASYKDAAFILTKSKPENQQQIDHYQHEYNRSAGEQQRRILELGATQQGNGLTGAPAPAQTQTQQPEQ